MHRREYGSFSKTEWRALKRAYGNRCLCCGKPGRYTKLTVDHVVPVALGGSSYIDNLQPLCPICNNNKSDTYADYRPDGGDAARRIRYASAQQESHQRGGHQARLVA